MPGIAETTSASTIAASPIASTTLPAFVPIRPRAIVVTTQVTLFISGLEFLM
jgi:hypothetical protein